MTKRTEERGERKNREKDEKTEKMKKILGEQEYVKRSLEKEIQKYINSPEILAIVGPRQAGKTTLLYKIHTELKNSNFISFEDREKLNLFEEDEKEFAEIHLKDHNYLLIDEFQYAEEGGKKLKYLYDTYPDKKILITGSSTANMTVKGLKHLTGRVLRFKLHPFSFKEFLRYKNKKLHNLYTKKGKQIKKWIKKGKKPEVSKTILTKLERLRKEYIIYGGYPRVALSDSKEKKKKILDNIVDTYLIKEIKDVLGISEDKEIEKLMKILALQMGDKTNYNTVREKTGLHHTKLKKRLNILEHTFILKQVNPFYTNKQKEIVKSPKIYFYDNGFRNSLLNSFQKPELRDDHGKLNENFLFTQAKRELKYWRTKSKAEVDFIIEKNTSNPIPLEVKTTPNITKSFRSFQEKYQPEKAFIMNEKELKKEEKTFLIPLIFSEQVIDQIEEQ